MSLRTLVLLVAALPAAAQLVPTLRVEPAAGGSVFFVKNTAAQPVTAYLIELVGYPGSSYSFWQDKNGAELIPAGGEQRIPVANMTVGAVPEYVKMEAAIFADGSTAGVPEKVAQLTARRRAVLSTTRELVRRLETARSAGTAKPALIAELEQWSNSLEPSARSRRVSQASIDAAAARERIGETVGKLNGGGIDDALGQLRAAELSLAASKPPL